MNIFIMIFAVLIMGAYFIMSSPAQRVAEQETEYAITQADLHSVAECAVAVHNAAIRGYEFDDICVDMVGIETGSICLNERLAETKCEVVRNKKPAYSYIITTTAALDDVNYDAMMTILEKNYSDAGTFGILQDGQIVAGGTATRRTIPAAIIKARGLTDGQLVYMTQYEMPDTDTEFVAPDAADIDCPAGTVKTYRFSRWQCVGYNYKYACGGDMIWSSDLAECVPDESRKPLCASEQTAVMVDSVWECVNPFPDKDCPNGMVARLNYSTLEWECVADPTNTPTQKKCANFTAGAIYGAVGATVRVPSSSCTDCEKLIVDENTCQTKCVPDPTKISDTRCYPAASHTCSGSHRAFYFGFPSAAYASNVDALGGRSIPMDSTHSRNRKFNCLDCGDGEIDGTNSFPPYIAVCKFSQ